MSEAEQTKVHTSANQGAQIFKRPSSRCVIPRGGRAGFVPAPGRRFRNAACSLSRTMHVLKLETILSAVDTDDSSKTALRTAEDLAKAAGAALHVVHVESAKNHGVATGDRFDPAVIRATDARFHSLSGDPPTTIRDFAEHIGADVIVLGPHRTANANPAHPLGSTAMDVVTNAAAPFSLPARDSTFRCAECWSRWTFRIRRAARSSSACRGRQLCEKLVLAKRLSSTCSTSISRMPHPRRAAKTNSSRSSSGFDTTLVLGRASRSKARPSALRILQRQSTSARVNARPTSS